MARHVAETVAALEAQYAALGAVQREERQHEQQQRWRRQLQQQQHGQGALWGEGQAQEQQVAVVDEGAVAGADGEWDPTEARVILGAGDGTGNGGGAQGPAKQNLRRFGVAGADGEGGVAMGSEPTPLAPRVPRAAERRSSRPLLSAAEERGLEELRREAQREGAPREAKGDSEGRQGKGEAVEVGQGAGGAGGERAGA